MDRLISLVGIAAIIALGVLFSSNRKAINWRLVAWGLGLQAALAVFVLKTSAGRWIFQKAGDGITNLLGFAREGAIFVFGNLVSDPKSFGFIFAFQVLPTILFMSALVSILYHLEILQKVVSVLAKLMVKTMGTSGAESLSAAANIFVGQLEGPLTIKPYIPTMTRSELTAVMAGGMATISGGVMAAYIGMGISASHLLAASIMGAPAGLVMAKLMEPETEEPKTKGGAPIAIEKTASNVIEAAANGAIEGMNLSMVVAAMLIVFVALIAMINAGFGLIGTSLDTILGYIFAPLAFLMGAPSADMMTVGALIGKKIALNEFVAYADLSAIIAGKGAALSAKSIAIATYALCGFANFSSIAICVGGLGAMAPERKGVLAELGPKAMLAGALASCMTGTIAGLLL